MSICAGLNEKMIICEAIERKIETYNQHPFAKEFKYRLKVNCICIGGHCYNIEYIIYIRETTTVFFIKTC